MKFYVIEITTYNDGTKNEFAVYEKNTRDDAISLFHQKMSSAIKSSLVASELCTVMKSNGALEAQELHHKEADPEV